jgi:hypothetical protein
MLHFLLEADRLVKPLAWFAIAVSISTWVMELTGMVSVCPYCQTQRTMIGLVGIVMLLPWVNIITLYCTLVLGSFGAYVAAMQVWNNFLKKAFDGYWLYLAACAFLLLSGQLIVQFMRRRT